MTPQQIRDLADRQDRVSPDAALFVAPVLRALADLYEVVRKKHTEGHAIQTDEYNCATCDAVASIEDLQP